ncbi:MAG: hypothetical protein P8130_13805 [Deltaproteobacteria bacterium]
MTDAIRAMEHGQLPAENVQLTPAKYKAMDKQAEPMKMEEGNED